MLAEPEQAPLAARGLIRYFRPSPPLVGVAAITRKTTQRLLQAAALAVVVLVVHLMAAIPAAQEIRLAFRPAKVTMAALVITKPVFILLPVVAVALVRQAQMDHKIQRPVSLEMAETVRLRLSPARP